MDPSGLSSTLMKDPKFMEMFQKVLGDGKIPDEKDPNRDKWLKEMQDKLSAEATKEAKKHLETPVSDKDGQWMYVIPEPGFCIKCSGSRGSKIFINICKHERIAEPIPLEPEEQEEDDAIKFKIPLSCGQARTDNDKAGKPCKVYDVIVNPNTIQRCADDNEFRRFVAALCMTWIKQKSEPDLNADEFKNVNFKCKGVAEAQRIRLSAAQKPSNAMGDEIQLPSKGTATGLAQTGGRGDKPLVQVINPSGESVEDNKVRKAPEPTFVLKTEGIYDWSPHAKAARHPNFRDTVPKEYHVVITIPGITTIKEVVVQVVRGRSLELAYVDDEEKPFLQIPLPFRVLEDPTCAKFVKSKAELRLVLEVSLPDETDIQNKTKASRDATEEEEEERKKNEELQDQKLKEQRERYERKQQEETSVMNQRKEYVENISAMQEGVIPPVIREEFESMNSEQQRAMLMRLEGKIRRGDSVDQLLDKLPDDVIGSICVFLRGKLGLEQRQAPVAKGPPAEKKVRFDEKAPLAEKDTNEWTQQLDNNNSTTNVEYNFAKKAETLFGVEMNNRYLFALDQ
jgi:hypothetical protein